MGQGEMGPVGGAPAAGPAPRSRRRSILGKIGLVLAIVPYVFLLVMIKLNPG